MDHNNKKWKKRLLGLLGCLAGLVIIIVLGGAFMFRHEIKTLGTLEKIDDNVLYSMRYDGDYGFDDFLEIGASTDGELVRFVTERLLKGLPFVSSVLLKIYNSMGLNWERVGNVRFAVTYQPGDGNERAYTKERAIQIAQEWRKAMKSGGDISDFVAVGNVKIQTIGADNQILDSEVPVRQMLEQIIAKLSIPPFLLGLSWSTTERMSAQQADILTSELEAYRRILNPVIGKVCSLWLRLHGYSPEHTVVWDDINLQDAVELSNARLLEARAKQIEQELEPEREPEAPLEGGTQ